MDNTFGFHVSHANISSRTWYQKISPLFVAFVSKTLNLDPTTHLYIEDWAVAIALAGVGLGSLLAIQPLVEQFFTEPFTTERFSTEFLDFSDCSDRPHIP